MIKIASIVGARPQFIKVAPICWELKKKEGVKHILIHTGQHYDYEMSKVFFDELQIPAPDYHLEVGSGSHGWQTAEMLRLTEEALLKEKPDVILVYGDTNSTLAGALAAAKLHIPVAHVEAGLRSFNKKMPEEVNRVLTDHISTYLFCPSETATENLRREGFSVSKNKNEPPDIDHPLVVQVGDVMHDMLLHALKYDEENSRMLDNLKIVPKGYDLLTLHRAENADDPLRLEVLIKFVNEVTANVPVILPMHPRMTKAYAGVHKPFAENVRIIEPLGYFDLLMVLKNARQLLTDSGGMQKEAYWLQVPCITLRDETEWIETVELGWNILCGADRDRIIRTVRAFKAPSEHPPLYGDGNSAWKILEALGVRGKVVRSKG